MVFTVLAAVFNVMSLQIVMLAGASAAVLTGCLTTRQAYRSIDARIYLFIAGAVPLGAAMKKSGASAVVAQWLQ
jgi:di/tricarboxylate transporter